MLRFVLLFFVVGLGLIGSGCYDLFIQAGTSRQPTTISIGELHKAVPANRHLIVTGGCAVPETAVVYYKTKWGQKVSGSEIFFIPITEAGTSASQPPTPAVLLRVSEDQMEEAQAGKPIDYAAVEGVRTTSLELQDADKARRRLVERYGQAAVEQMVILDYHGKLGMGLALLKLTGGLALTGAIVAGFLWLRKPKASPPPIPGSVPPPIPAGAVR